jgi:molybdopterin synthase catalytic subunit
MIALTQERIDVAKVLDSVRSETAGGVVHFLGTIRNDGGIDGLQYDSYPVMAQKILESIASEARRRWPVEEVSVVHRVGWIPVGEEAVVVAVGSAHRAEAFEACRYVIDTLKRDAPIWKIEGGKRAACC